MYLLYAYLIFLFNIKINYKFLALKKKQNFIINQKIIHNMIAKKGFIKREKCFKL